MRNLTHSVVISLAFSVTVLPSAHASGLPSAHAPDDQVIHYAGMSVSVPADWPVYDLQREPWRCVRYDQHAVYLGQASPDADCPAHLVDRTETLQITPPVSGADRRARPEAPIQVEDSASQEILVHPSTATGTAVVTYGDDRPLIGHILQSFTPRLPPSATTVTDPPPDQTDPGQTDPNQPDPNQPGQSQPDPTIGSPSQSPEEDAQAGGGRRSGRGFDTCMAPSLRTMRAWRGAYGVVSVYVGGAARACAQPNLTAGWVRSVRRMGYRLIPTYVGPQAPCTHFRDRFSGRNAGAAGSRSADDAVRAARRLGIPRRSPLYYDMEWYSSGDTGCRRAALTFMDAWSRRVEARGYVSGVYSSAAAGIRDLVHASGIRRPTAIWFARWDGNPSVQNSPYLPRRLWNPHRRIKQYKGDHHESHGGVRLNVDSDAVDGVVY